MVKKLSIISILVLVFSAGSVFGQCFPDQCSECIATMPGAGGYAMALFVIPDGTGSFFYNAQIRDDGSSIDAHIELIVNDVFGIPVPNYPAEDMWLASENGTMVPCAGGSAADQNTDAVGFTEWVNPLRAGGFDTGLCTVVVNGYTVNYFALGFNSSDITGDGVVNLADIGLFSGILFGAYDFSADYFADGVINLADVGRLALGLGRSCP